MSDSEKYHLAPCPFCKGTSQSIKHLREEIGNDLITVYQVHCQCGASGPRVAIKVSEIPIVDGFYEKLRAQAAHCWNQAAVSEADHGSL